MTHPAFWLGALALCASCSGNSFESGASGGAGGAAGSASGGTTAGGGTTGVSGGAGAPSGGTVGSAGAAGASAGAAGASAGSGGIAAGGAGAGGSGGTADCVTLTADYEAAAEKARGCDSGSTDECSKSSTLPVVGCGCPILVNAKSDFLPAAQQKYKAVQAAKCASGPICNIACLAYTDATCAAQKTASGTAFRCTGTQSGTAN